ncbi:hypothetical protein HUG15_19305 [Salicibibacter cibarius]|uniref:Cytosolic protein n=1 Tax=Salicibibacter cibarius TaxID=2743000 RepID=A0A7T6Z606_9BACI|nr:hypothetical protein [Salicibibacter cibarius]QQK77515.1 hypothetical protein HUG15_19305 [Salicibibacter cibarius]
MPRKNNTGKYRDFESVESQENDLISEELAEGPYGTPFEGTIGKSSPWRPGQQMTSPFIYENRELHAGGGRLFPNTQTHKVHSSKDDDNDVRR